MCGIFYLPSIDNVQQNVQGTANFMSHPNEIHSHQPGILLISCWRALDNFGFSKSYKIWYRPIAVDYRLIIIFLLFYDFYLIVFPDLPCLTLGYLLMNSCNIKFLFYYYYFFFVDFFTTVPWRESSTQLLPFCIEWTEKRAKKNLLITSIKET